MEPIGPNIPGQPPTTPAAPAPFMFPPDTVLGNAERRARLEAAGENVVKTTAKLALIARLVPSLPGRIFATAVAGVGKTETGKVVPTTGTAANFLPQPIGFLDPAAVGLKRNFYLPAGATDYVPRIADRAGIGLPEQRLEDVDQNIRDRVAAVSSDRRGAVRAVAGESDDTLRDIIAGRGGPRRSGVVIGFSGVPLVSLQDAAAVELRARTANLSQGLEPPTEPEPPRPLAPAPPVPGEEQEVSHIAALDRLFAANPPDP